MSAFMPDRYVQIDVKRVENNTVVCNLYTGGRCVKIVMRADDYELLIRDGFFTRDGKKADSADVINTTGVFIPEKK